MLAGQGDVIRNPAKDENVDKVHQIASSTVSSLWLQRTGSELGYAFRVALYCRLDRGKVKKTKTKQNEKEPLRDLQTRPRKEEKDADAMVYGGAGRNLAPGPTRRGMTPQSTS